MKVGQGETWATRCDKAAVRGDEAVGKAMLRGGREGLEKAWHRV